MELDAITYMQKIGYITKVFRLSLGRAATGCI